MPAQVEACDRQVPVGEGMPDAQAWCAEVQTGLARLARAGSDMGVMERYLEEKFRELGRPLLEQGLHRAASQYSKECPSCRKPLQVTASARSRKVLSMFGGVRVTRDYGFCSGCAQRMYPADRGLGLQPRAFASPRVQEACALAVLDAPAAKACDTLRRMTGVHIGQATLHREAYRCGVRALELRRVDMNLTKTLEGLRTLSSRAKVPSGTFTLIIEIDAWNIRERDAWGETRALRKQGKEVPSRWHWVYTGTIFRLDQRGKTAAGRPIISERGYVATREGLESFERQLYAEALQRGLLNAKDVLVLADGAVWIWNLAENRFGCATQRIDFFHVSAHLWSVAHDMFGKDSPEAYAWIRPLLRNLKTRKDGALDVINSLEQLRASVTNITAKQVDTLERELAYMREHKDRMDYKNARNREEPLGSGAIESTCGQYQTRFKRTGQFWSLAGDEAFLALTSLRWNNRWHTLFPHSC